jgi:hypothetical protein
VGDPEATTANVAVEPALTVRADGEVTIAGGKPVIVSDTATLVAEPSAFFTTTE